MFPHSHICKYAVTKCKTYLLSRHVFIIWYSLFFSIHILQFFSFFCLIVSFFSSVVEEHFLNSHPLFYRLSSAAHSLWLQDLEVKKKLKWKSWGLCPKSSDLKSFLNLIALYFDFLIIQIILFSFIKVTCKFWWKFNFWPFNMCSYFSN